MQTKNPRQRPEIFCPVLRTRPNYENNIGVIATRKEGAAFIIHSPDLAYSMRQLFDFLWSVSLAS